MVQGDERSAYSPPSNPRTIGVYDLRTHWFEYLRRARDGEVFIITRRGKPVAQLEPLPPDHPARSPGRQNGGQKIRATPEGIRKHRHE